MVFKDEHFQFTTSVQLMVNSE